MLCNAMARDGTGVREGPCEEVTCDRDRDLKESENRRAVQAEETAQAKALGLGRAHLVGGREVAVGAVASSQARRPIFS